MMQSINEIEPGLYLSSRKIAETEEILEANGITHILTIDTWPLRREIYSKPDNYVFRYLCKNDEENVDLLTHFEECNEFIREGRTVLVHCYVGMSRSATIVLAYLMNKYKISYEDALSRVIAERWVSPNDGFAAQLKLYERMGFTLDKDVLGYKFLYLTSIISEVCSHVGFPNMPEEDRQKINSVLTVTDSDIRCRQCRWPLASSKYIVPHKYREEVTYITTVENPSQNESKQKTRQCGDEFVLPTEGIMAKCHGLAGKIYCPKCSNKVGRFAWIGLNCDCGASMKPGFVLSTSKIDQKLAELSLHDPVQEDS